MELLDAAKNGDFTTVFSLLQRGYKTDIRDHDNATPLYWGACHGHSTLCEVLLQAGSDVNARVKWGSTPLHAASDRGHIACVCILLENGAAVNCQNNRGDTALHIAAYRGNLEISKQLLAANTDKLLQNDKGKTPQDEAMEGGHREIADCILRFISEQNHARAQRTVRYTTPFNHFAQSVAPPLPTGLRNGMYDSARCQSFSSGNATSLSESACSSSYSISDTDTYDDTDSSMATVATETSRVHSAPMIFKRSISVGGRGTPRPVNHVALHLPHTVVAKTNSVGNMLYPGCTDRSVYYNDVNKGYSSLENVNLEASKASQFPNVNSVSDFSTKLTSNGRCIATESVDDSAADMEQKPVNGDSSEMGSFPNRPIRASTGFFNNLAKPSENEETFIKILQKQLVNAYKDIEQLTSERGDLKFKCSTVLNRLTDTEQQLEDKMRECEALRELVNTSRKTTESNVQKKAMDTSAVTSEGIKSLVVKINNELPDVTHLQSIMQAHLVKMSQRTKESGDMLELGNREWVPGIDYVITGEKQPVCIQPCNSSRVPVSVNLLIKHLKSGRRLLLKMLLILDSPHSPQWVFKPVPLKCERQVPDRLLLHSNISKYVHKYESLTDRFKQFVKVPDSKRVQFCRKTTFMVMEEAKTFRTLLECVNRNRDSKNRLVLEYGLLMEFMLHVTYSLLSVVCDFEESNVFHGNISEDSVFFDKRLKPLLCNIEFNQFDTPISCVSDTGENEPTGPQFHAYGNGQPVNKSCDDLVSLCEMLRRSIFTKDHVTCLKSCDNNLQQKLASVQQILRKAATSNEESRTQAKSVFHSVGCILFGPRNHAIHRELDCRVFIQTQVLRLTTNLSNSRNEAPCSEFVSIPESVALRRPEVETHFLCNITSDELWDIYQCCHREGWLVS